MGGDEWRGKWCGVSVGRFRLASLRKCSERGDQGALLGPVGWDRVRGQPCGGQAERLFSRQNVPRDVGREEPAIRQTQLKGLLSGTMRTPKLLRLAVSQKRTAWPKIYGGIPHFFCNFTVAHFVFLVTRLGVFSRC